MPGAGETPVAESGGQSGPDPLVRATAWVDGSGFEAFEPQAVPPGRILWFDVERRADPAEVLQLLRSRCDGLQLEMLEDLLCPDDIPEGRRWQGGKVRLASTFAVYAPEARRSGGLVLRFTSSSEAVYEPVELLAGEDWLITRWHDACVYRGARAVEDGLPPLSRDALREAVSRRWEAKGGGIDKLRNSLHLLHIQKSEEQRERNERLQRRIEILAPIFVVPTLVVGFYGANTWVPAEHRHWGFLVMVASIVVLTCITAAVLWATSRRHQEGLVQRETGRAP